MTHSAADLLGDSLAQGEIQDIIPHLQDASQ